MVQRPPRGPGSKRSKVSSFCIKLSVHMHTYTHIPNPRKLPRSFIPQELSSPVVVKEPYSRWYRIYRIPWCFWLGCSHSSVPLNQPSVKLWSERMCVVRQFVRCPFVVQCFHGVPCLYNNPPPPSDQFILLLSCLTHSLPQQVKPKVRALAMVDVQNSWTSCRLTLKDLGFLKQ